MLSAKVEKESELTLLGVKKEIYTPEMRRALTKYEGWLRAEGKKLGREVERGWERLGGYGVVEGVGLEKEGMEGEGVGGDKKGEREGDEEEKGEGGDKKGERKGDPEKEKVMREIARVYGQMEREVEVVRRDLERLGGV